MFLIFFLKSALPVDLSLYGKSRKAKLMFSDHPFQNVLFPEKYEFLIIHSYDYKTQAVIGIMFPVSPGLARH